MAYSEIYVDPSKQTRTSVTITNATTTATVTQNSHGYSTSDVVKIHGATESAYNGNWTISNVTTNTYDYTMGSDPGGSATGSPVASKLNLSGDDGTTDALAWADLQYALDNATQDVTNGNRINIKAGTAEVATTTLDYSTFGTSNQIRTLVFQGYTTTAGDGGIGEIDGNNGNFSISGTRAYTNWADMNLGNTGTAIILTLSTCSCYNCEFHTCTNSSAVLVTGEGSVCYGSHFHNCSGSGVLVEFDGLVVACYFKNGTNDFSGSTGGAIDIGQQGFAFLNTISVDGASNGIYCFKNRGRAFFNSVLSDGGSGTGIGLPVIGVSVFGNLVEGFSDTGGVGIDTNGIGQDFMTSANTVYDCATPYDLQSTINIDPYGNETGTASPFKKTGSDTFANRDQYFEPVDTDDVLSVEIGNGVNKYRGAIQPPGGGGATVFAPIISR